nr:uncharacterized protein CTRU02_02414 [Colletotrichum truncatum]KAF6798440.1 hypothetical protein CTRU02_02414 [Colletotrichum truncatum]
MRLTTIPASIGLLLPAQLPASEHFYGRPSIEDTMHAAVVDHTRGVKYFPANSTLPTLRMDVGRKIKVYPVPSGWTPPTIEKLHN